MSKMPKVGNIDIRFLPQVEIRYNGLGDWWFDGPTLHIRAAAMDAPHETFLIALHELVEAWLCAAHGVRQEDVDAFDAAFTGDGEPGDDPRAPYRAEHRQAMLIEMIVANFLGMVDYGEVR